MNCDPLARCYRTVEHLAFGKRLEKARLAFLEEAADAKLALLLGEGDGRFVLALARRNTTVAIDCIEASRRMIDTATRRLREGGISSPDRVRFLQGDARVELASGGPYDLIVSHFFLDCFTDNEVKRLVGEVRKVCRPGATWLIADFQEPARGWRRWHARSWLWAMYGFFRLATGLETRALASYRDALRDAGFRLRRRSLSFAELICSEVWQLG